MNFSIENLDNNSYLVVELPLHADIDTMALGMITNNKIVGLAPAVFMQLDNVKYVKYNITSLSSLKETFAGTVNRKKIITIFKNICNALSTANDYMIDLGSIYYDLNQIYIDNSTYDVKMLCIPIVDLNQSVTDIGMLFKELMFSAQFDTAENNDYVGKIINYMNSSGSFVIEDFKALLATFEGDNSEAAPQIIAQSAPRPMAAQKVTPMVAQEKPGTVQTGTVQPSVVPSAPTVLPAQGSMPQQNVQTPAKNIVVPQTNIPQVPKAESRGKKGLGLFGKKEPKEGKQKPEKVKSQKNKKNNAPAPGMPVQGMTIPGTPPAINGKPMPPTINGNTMPPTPGNPVSTQAPAAKANFGETTVLGGGAGIGETTVLSAVQMTQSQPYIVRLKTNDKITITKPVFRIGKEKSYVDYFIGDNTAISRSHANIVVRDGKYYIVDTHSTNHTYIDGQMIASDVEKEITNGMKFTLANEDFEFRAF